MWLLFSRVATWIGAALGILVALYSLEYFVIAATGYSKGESNGAGRTLGLAVVFLSLALLLAAPLVVSRSRRGVAGWVTAAVVVVATCMVGLALIVWNAY